MWLCQLSPLELVFERKAARDRGRSYFILQVNYLQPRIMVGIKALSTCVGSAFSIGIQNFSKVHGDFTKSRNKNGFEFKGRLL